MTQKVVKPCIVLVVTTLLARALLAQQQGCTNVLISLAPCLNFVTGGSSNPTPSCCSQLGTVVQKQLRCLCAVLNGGGASLGINNINQTLALALPSACSVTTPPISECFRGASPFGSPEGSPGSKTSQMTSWSSSIVTNLVLLVLVISAYASINSL